MLSSWQIAQMHGGQQQMFAAQHSYASQLSSQMPQPYSGGLGMAGSYGMGMSFGAGGGFSYGQNMSELGRSGFGNAAVSGAAGMGSAMFNPMTMGIGGAVGGFKMGGIRGAMVGGGLGMAAGGMAGHVFNSFAHGAQEQNMLDRTLSQFQFVNASSSTGRGFNRGDSKAIGNLVRQMERVPEMLTSFGELNRVMDKMGQMGLMQGVRDAGEFMNKFRSTVGTLKDMAKMMGTTMEGALQAFGEQRQAGFYNKADILKNTLVAQTTGALTGMGTQQVVQMQQAGGALAHSMGGSRRGGAMMMARNLGQLGMANQMGIISNDQIMEMTGKEGAEGIADIAGQMSQLSYRMAQSAPGTLLTLGLAQTGAKGYTGRIDQELAERVRKGEISLGELKKIARQKVSQFGRGNKLFYGAHGKRMRAEMAAATGAEGQGMMLQEILGERGWQNPDATNLVMQRFGASEEQANLLQQLMPNLQNIQGEMAAAGKTEARARATQSMMKERYSPDAISHRIKKKLQHALTDPIKDLGNSVRDYINNYVEGYVDDLTGQYKTVITQDFANSYKLAAGGNKDAAARLTRMHGAGQRARSGIGGSRLDVGAVGGARGLASRAMHFLGGGENAGELTARMLGELDQGKFLTSVNGGSMINPLEASGGDQLAAQGATVLTSTAFSGNAVGITAKDRRRGLSRIDELESQSGGMAEFKKLGAEGGAALAAYQRAMTRSDVILEKDASKRQDLIWKHMQKEIKSLGAGDALDKWKEQGMGGINVVAAAQAASQSEGRTYLGRSNIGAATGLGGLAGDEVAISAAMKKHEKDMMDKYKQSEKQLGWSEMKKMIDSGDPLAALLVGSDKYGGVMTKADEWRSGKGGVKFEEASGEKLRYILSRFGSWSPEDREFIEKVTGAPADEIEKKIHAAGGSEFIGRALALGEKGEGDLLKHMGLTTLSAEAATSKQVADEGRRVKKLLADRSGDVDLLSKSDAGKDLVKALTEYSGEAEAQRGSKDFDPAKWAAKSGDHDWNMAKKLRGMKGEERAAAERVAGAGATAGARRADVVEKQLRNMRGGKTSDVDEVMSVLGYTDKGSSDYQMQKKQIEEMLGSDFRLDKSKGSKEMEGIISMAGKQASSQIRAGETAGSKYMNEEQVAQELTKMTDNNVKVAAILSNLAAGKTGADAFKDVIKPSGQEK